MAKQTLTPRLLAEHLAASPEGFFRQSELAKIASEADLPQIVAEGVVGGQVGQEGDFLFDPSRVNAEQVRERGSRYSGTLTAVNSFTKPIVQRMKQRDDQLARLDNPAYARLVNAFDGTPGYMPLAHLCSEPGDETLLGTLLQKGMLKAHDDLVFDPLRITRGSLKEIHRTQLILPLREELNKLLESRPGQTAPRSDLVENFGASNLQAILDVGGFTVFSVSLPLGESVWIRLKGSDAEQAKQVAWEAVQPKEEDWAALLTTCGDELRHGVKDGDTARERIAALSYTLQQAASRTGLRMDTLHSAAAEKRLAVFVDPEGVQRIPAARIEALFSDEAQLEEIAGLEAISVRELAVAMNASTPAVRQKLRRAQIGANRSVRWRQVAGRFGLPETLRKFKARYAENKSVWIAAREEERAAERRQRDAQRRVERARRDEERRQREELRARLLASFPAWQHAGRADQQVILHIGPPNSGKTHAALDVLSIANSGWYLAPLRLLAFEIFDRLNQRGIRCSLLTGEEYINVPGAAVTAATIEMFNPVQSGDCVVIDEAQMLADPDRGWAWTRALMEAQSPEIHVIGPPHARDLIERLAGAAAIPIQIVPHERLAPIAVAREPWPIEHLPKRTILVAFSRRTVLHLKTELEMLRRSVSVVYGNLPPEVRRKQADRFAAGQTEICVATDAVGMGLNLPADQVCFFELEKFDGRMVRPLNSAEAHQIGGRAGRYGMSSVGLVGATSRRGLRILQRLYESEPKELTHARVAPVVEDLALIPGSLAHRFAQWAELQSIPDSLRNVIKPADIDERIALARMLTDKEVEQLGLEAAVRLVNAPTREISRDYWRACAAAILSETAMPHPPDAPFIIENDHQLDQTEQSIACGDIYLWLSRRQEFSRFGSDEERVREMRTEWSMSIDAALLRRLDTLARCVNCRKPLPLGHRYSLCDACYNQRSNYWY